MLIYQEPEVVETKVFGGGGSGLHRDVGMSERQYVTLLELGGEKILSLALGSSRGHQWQEDKCAQAVNYQQSFWPSSVSLSFCVPGLNKEETDSKRKLT